MIIRRIELNLIRQFDLFSVDFHLDDLADFSLSFLGSSRRRPLCFVLFGLLRFRLGKLLDGAREFESFSIGRSTEMSMAMSRGGSRTVLLSSCRRVTVRAREGFCGCPEPVNRGRMCRSFAKFGRWRWP